MRVLETRGQVRKFLRLAGVYRRFVPKFANISKPLTMLTRDEAPPKIDTLPADALEEFGELIRQLTNPTTLALPRREGYFLLDTDASKVQVGGCLQQRNEGGRSQSI